MSKPKSKLTLKGLVDAPYNPRTIGDDEFDRLKISLDSFGDLAGLVYNRRTGHMVCGHQRLRALKDQYGDDLKMVAGKIVTPSGESFPVRVVDWDDATEKAANVAANHSGLQGDWTEGLAGVLEDIHAGLPEMYSDLALENLLAGIDVGPAEGQTDPDEVPEAVKKPVVKIGDLWICGEHRVVCGDATKAEDVAKVLGGAEPFLMVTDPPYGVDYDPEWRNQSFGDGDRAIGRVANDDRAGWSEAYKLFPGDVAYTWSPPGDHVLITGESICVAGFQIRAMLIWGKGRFAISRGHYHYQHEPVWYAVRKGKSARWAGGRSQTSLWSIDHSKNETGHSTQKPVECMERPIRNHGGKGDHVYDPFLGSGTTMIAAERLGRRSFGIEIEPKYVQVALQRWADFTGKDPVREDGKKLSVLLKKGSRAGKKRTRSKPK